MRLFITSSPFVPDGDGPIFSNENGFVDRLREVLPPFPNCLFVASDPERHDLTCQWGTDMITAMAGQGIYSGSFAVLDGSKCILQLRGVRPFLSDKYDLTQHPNYKYTSDFDKRNEFNIEQFLSRRLKLKAGDEFVVVDAD